jgi:AraC family transcriptional regulator of adaptative response / DNA-3-methyladenine glycosylase II
VRAVVGQQISVAGARTLLGRLAAAHGEALADGGARLFPTAQRLADADVSDCGVTRARAATIRALARAAADGSLVLDGSDAPGRTIARLRDLPGVGRWTAGYVAMRALKDPDAFPHGDVALVKAAHRLGIADTAAALDDAAEAWRPWRAYAAMHLWNSLPKETPRARRTAVASA